MNKNFERWFGFWILADMAPFGLAVIYYDCCQSVAIQTDFRILIALFLIDIVIIAGHMYWLTHTDLSDAE